MILGGGMANEAGFDVNLKTCFILFPLFVHCLDIVASTVGMHFVSTKKGLPDFEKSYSKFQEPLEVMKKGYKVAMSIGFFGFIFLCYSFLDYNGSWLNFSLCGLVGIIISFTFIELTQYYTDYNFAPVKSIV